MGKKLDLSPNDSLLQIDDIQGEGLLTACGCCGKQIYLFFEDIEDLPLTKVDDIYFYANVCEDCKDDIQILERNGVKKFSYDILWLIQKDLDYVLEQEEVITKEDRDNNLVKLYKNMETKINLI